MTTTEPRHTGDLEAGAGSGVTALYASGHSRVLRLEATGLVGGEVSGTSGSVIWKELLGAGAVERMRHEVAILARLAGVPGVAGLVETPGGGSGFAMVGGGGESLAETLGASTGGDHSGLQSETDVIDVVTFALTLAGVVEGVHRAGVVHKDINPANVLVCDGRPVLIDWDLATTFAEERPASTHLNAIAGTLAYLAPEQTGRTGRVVDHRADIYALGVDLAMASPSDRAPRDNNNFTTTLKCCARQPKAVLRGQPHPRHHPGPAYPYNDPASGQSLVEWMARIDSDIAGWTFDRVERIRDLEDLALDEEESTSWTSSPRTPPSGSPLAGRDQRSSVHSLRHSF